MAQQLLPLEIADGVGLLSQNVAHMLGGAALLLSFALLYQRRIARVLDACALQGMVLAVAALWQGWSQGAPRLLVTAVMVLAAAGVAIPMALRHAALRRNMHREIGTVPGSFTSMLLSAGLVVLSMSVALPREDLALALALVLLAALTMVMRRDALAQAAGFLSLGNGLILAAISVPDMPLVEELTGAVLALTAFGTFGVVSFRERLDPPDAGRPGTAGGPAQ